MKIILNQDVNNLGEEGDVRDVKRGYARNYLLPQNLAVPYSKTNIAVFESRKAIIQKRKDEKRMTAKGLKDKIEAQEILLNVTAGDTGKLFGSVSNATIADELQKLGIAIERKKIEVPENIIKTVGIYTVKIKLYEGETAELKVTVQDEKKAAKSAAEVTAAVKKPSVVEEPVLEAHKNPVVTEEESGEAAETEDVLSDPEEDADREEESSEEESSEEDELNN